MRADMPTTAAKQADDQRKLEAADDCGRQDYDASHDPPADDLGRKPTGVRLAEPARQERQPVAHREWHRQPDRFEQATGRQRLERRRPSRK